MTVQTSLLRLLDDLIGSQRQALRFAVDTASQAARETDLWNDKTGVTRRSIKGRVADDNGFVAAGGVAHWLEYGTRPHRIEGNPWLVFSVNGETVFARGVNHPGTKPRPFMSKARDAGAKSLEYNLNRLTVEAIRKYG